MNPLAIITSIIVAIAPLSIKRVGDEMHVTVASSEAWALDASVDLTHWLEIANGWAPEPPLLFTVTVVRDNALQPMVFYRLRQPTLHQD